MAELPESTVDGPAPPPPFAPARPDTAAAHSEPAAPAKRAKVSKWDRPRRPRDWRFWVGGLGRVLLATGILMFGFVAYQLWGTGIETARAQRSLENEFEELLAAATTTVPTVPTVPTTVAATAPATVPPSTVASTTIPETVPPTTEPPAIQQTIPPIAEGDPVAHIEMPAIGADDIVVAGVSVADLRRGPGHFPETPLPGQLGNAAVAGHRTTYGQPFRHIDELAPGDEIVLTTVAGRFVYHVTGTEIVGPDDYTVVLTTDPTVATVTLVSCHPVWSASQRIVVRGVLDETLSDPVGFPTTYAGSTPPAPTETTVPATTPATTTPATTATTGTTGTTPTTADATTSTTATTVPAVVDDPPPDGAVSEESQTAFAGGWFHDEDAFLHVAVWGLAVTAISLGAWLLSRRTRHDLVGLAVGIVPFTIALFFFFQNVNRLLPPSL